MQTLSFYVSHHLEQTSFILSTVAAIIRFHECCYLKSYPIVSFNSSIPFLLYFYSARVAPLYLALSFFLRLLNTPDASFHSFILRVFGS